MQDNKSDSKDSYRSVFKSTGVYGGVQVVTIIISIVKSKLTALWLGTAGFGILGVLNSTISLVSSISNLGLASSAVRDISQANIAGQEHELAHVIKAISRAVILTGLLGSVIMFALSKYLSLWTFGNTEYIVAYMLLSLVVLFININQGHYAMLQGLRLVKNMAVARVLGAIFGLVFIVPCYLIGGLNGIVPSLILSSIASLCISKYFTIRIVLPQIKQSFKETYQYSKTTLKLGVMLMTTGFIGSLAELIIKSYITRYGSINEVGLYQAGWAINVQYLGLIFTAMATDYYPRLTQIFQSKSFLKIRDAINHQTEIALLIMSPLICGLLVFLPLVISLLYSSDFMEIMPMTRLLLIGSIIKAGSWAISFLFLAAGNGKIFLMNEIGIKVFNIPLYLICYRYFGLIGIGYGYIVNYLVYFIWVLIIAKRKHNYKPSLTLCKVFVFSLTIAIISLVAVVSMPNSNFSYLIAGVATLASVVYSYKQLDDKINFKDIINKIRSK